MKAAQYNTQGMRLRATFQRACRKMENKDWVLAQPAALAFARWLTPTLDGRDAGETVRARWSSCNWEDGIVEADVFPEYVPDVLAKAYKVCKTVDFYRITV